MSTLYELPELLSLLNRYIESLINFIQGKALRSALLYRAEVAVVLGRDGEPRFG